MTRSDFYLLCNQTIVWRATNGRDQYGKPTYAADLTFRGRRVFKSVRVAAQVQGQAVDVVSGSQIWILDALDIKQDDLVFVQGDTIFPPVISSSRFPDRTGNDFHTKVMLGKFTG